MHSGFRSEGRRRKTCYNSFQQSITATSKNANVFEGQTTPLEFLQRGCPRLPHTGYHAMNVYSPLYYLNDRPTFAIAIHNRASFWRLNGFHCPPRCFAAFTIPSSASIQLARMSSAISSKCDWAIVLLNSSPIESWVSCSA